MLRRLVRSLRRVVLARRRLLAALLAAVAVAAALRVLAPAAVPLTTVPVAARDLAPGTVLTAADLTAATVPRSLAPARVVDRPAGRVLTGPLDAGEVLTETRLVGEGLAEQAPGRVAVPVRLPDAGMADLLRVGDRVDLLATDAQSGADSRATVLASAVPVLALDPAGGGADGSATGAGSGASMAGRLVVLSLDRSEVVPVARGSATAFVTFAWSPR